MDEEWDAAGKELPTPAAVGANKWEGEDEDDEVKESWEDEEEEEKKDVEKQELPKAAQLKKPKKIRAEKIEEKERKLQEELERKAKLKEQEEEEDDDMTPAELQVEKVRQQKLQEEADLRVAMETFGTAESSAGVGIDAMNPTTEEEFEELQKALSKKINLCSKSTYFPSFAEELIRNICVNLTSNDLKKLKTTVENMFLEKSKIEKGDKAKKKGKGKVKLRVEGENVSSATLVNDYYNEYDDFDDFM